MNSDNSGLERILTRTSADYWISFRKPPSSQSVHDLVLKPNVSFLIAGGIHLRKVINTV